MPIFLSEWQTPPHHHYNQKLNSNSYGSIMREGGFTLTRMAEDGSTKVTLTRLCYIREAIAIFFLNGLVRYLKGVISFPPCFLNFK